MQLINTYEFKGDDRDFGGKFADSRLRSWINIKLNQIGSVPVATKASHQAGVSHRRWLKDSNDPNKGYDFAEKQAEASGRRVITNSLTGTMTGVLLKASAAYPFKFGSPNIDYQFRINLSVKDDKLRLTDGGLSHNLFPFYEAYIRYNGKNYELYDFRSPFGGPGPYNLGEYVHNCFIDGLGPVRERMLPIPASVAPPE